MNGIFVREKVVHCGKNFLCPEIYPYTGQQLEANRGGRRGKKKNVSAPAQKNLNDKRAKRYFVQLANSNFGRGDLVVHLSYAPEWLPESEEEARKIVARYLRRLAYLRKKRGLEPLKYLCVTQVGRKKNGSHRLHHHVLINGGLDRDEVEALWWAVKETRDREAVMYGYANADRLKPGKLGIAQMAGYMVQDSAGKSTGHSHRIWKNRGTGRPTIGNIPAIRWTRLASCLWTARSSGRFGSGNTRAGSLWPVKNRIRKKWAGIFI